MSTRVVKSLTQTTIFENKATGISLVKLPQTTTETNIKSILSTFNPKTVGKNFMAIVGYGLVSTLMENAKYQGLVDVKSQWVYIISDTDARYRKMTLFDKFVAIGDNIAFVYNTTKSDSACVVSYCIAIVI